MTVGFVFVLPGWQLWLGEQTQHGVRRLCNASTGNGSRTKVLLLPTLHKSHYSPGNHRASHF